MDLYEFISIEIDLYGIMLIFLGECAHELQPISVYEPNGDRWRQRSIAQAKMESGKGAHHRTSKTRATWKIPPHRVGLVLQQCDKATSFEMFEWLRWSLSRMAWVPAQATRSLR